MGKELVSMNDFNNNSDKQEFIKKLELLRDLEAEKPVEEMDVSLIKACVELILELRGETVKLTPEEIEEKVRKIPFVDTATLNTTPKGVKGRATKVKSRKILFIAAIIAVLVTIFTVTSIAFDWNIFDELKEKFGTVFNTPVNEEMKMDGVTVIMNGESVVYTDLETALSDKGLNILYPEKLPDGILLEELSFYKEFSKDKITFGFSEKKLLYSVTLNTKLSDEIKGKADEVLEINNSNFYLLDMKDISVVQMHFEYMGNTYKISYTEKQGLIDIIENLKELE
jgi:hypothetical protein